MAIKKTVLEYVQATLTSMDSDQVDAIADTEESMQVAETLRDVYYELLERQDWEWLHGPVALVSPSDEDLPTLLNLPDDSTKVDDVWYNVEKDGFEPRKLIWRDPMHFLATLGRGKSTQSDRKLMTLGDNLKLYVDTDRQPRFYTSFDDGALVCDAFDISEESTLATSRVTAYGVSLPEFNVTDSFTPELPANMVPLLQHSLNATCSLLFKQLPSQSDERKVLRLMAQARRRHSRTQDRTYYYSNAFGRR